MLEESFSQDVAGGEKEPRPGSLAMLSRLPDSLGSDGNRAVSPAELANDAGLSHFPPTGLPVKQGVSWYLKGVCEGRREGAEGGDSRGDGRRVARRQVSPGALVSGHLDPLGHVLEDGVHGPQGVPPLRGRGPVVVALHVDALVVDGGQVGPATPGGREGRVQLREAPPAFSALTRQPVPGEGQAKQTP